MTRSHHIATVLCIAVGLTAAIAHSQAAAQVETLKFTVALSPTNEVPAITNDEGKGSGEAAIVMHVTRDASKTVTTATVDITVSVKAFPSGTTLTAAHIHRGSAGNNGGVAVNPMFSAGELMLTGGSGVFSKMGVTVPPAVAEEILSAPSSFYFNMHSMLNAGGVARGQLTTSK